MRRLCISLLLLMFLKPGFCQPVLQWAKEFTGVNPHGVDALSNGRSVAVDRQGNVYTVGYLKDNVDFDPGPGEYLINGAGPFNRGIYISKLSATGDFIWARQIPAAIEFASIELALDKDDNVFVTSYFTFTADMDPGPGVLNITATGARDAFVIKLDAGGNLLWVKQFGGLGYNVAAEGTSVTTDADGNVIVCGIFYGVVDFESGPGVVSLNSGDHFVSFIAKLNRNGDLLWVKSYGNFQDAYGDITIMDVKTDASGNIYTTGHFAGKCDFDPGAATYHLLSGGPADGFIAKTNPDGNFVWAKHVGNPVNANNYYVMPHGMELDSENNVYTSGTFIGPQDFDPGSGEFNLASVAGTMDAYLLKLTGDGEFVWVQGMGGSEHDYGADLGIDNENNIYVSGGFTGSVDFDPGPGESTIGDLVNNEFVFTKLSSDGAFIYKAAFRGQDGGHSPGRRLVIDPAQNIYITGYVGGTVDFDPGPGTFTLSYGSPWSPFVVKLGRCKNVTRSTLEITACNNYSLNGKLYDQPGVYTQTIPNAAGCDSVITLDLTLQLKRTEQSKTICEGEFFFAGGGSQSVAGTYIDTLLTSIGCDSIVTTYLAVNPKPVPSLGADKNLCRNDNLVITPGSFESYRWQDGSIANSFTVDKPGLYWVNVTNADGCAASDSFRVNAIIEPPSNFLKPVDSICQDQKLSIASLQNFTDYRWSTGASQSTIIVESPGKYWLDVTAANGCSGSDTITILRKQNCEIAVYIPTAFTPNADGNNDLFRATVYGNVQSFRLQVYDRAGQLIFQTTDPAGNWNGFYKGILQPATTYVWQCTYQFERGVPQYQKGTVTLIR